MQIFRFTPTRTGGRHRQLIAALVAIALCGGSAASESLVERQEGVDLSLSGLLDLSVSSVSRNAEPLFTAASAVSVVTADDLFYGHVRNLPDALRGIPGITVSRINGNQWEVGSRGFGYVFSNKMQVLIDGRSVYTPTFSGVYWEQHALPIDDIERIEAIRGPGSSVWGSNAVSGVVNVTSKPAFDTLGWLTRVGLGTLEQEAVVRYGWQLGQVGALRITGRFFHHGDGEGVDGVPADDESTSGRLDLRYDWEPTAEQRVTVQGAFQRQDRHEVGRQPLREPPYLRYVPSGDQTWNGYLQASWEWRHAISGRWRLRGAIDGYERPNFDGSVDARERVQFEALWDRRFGATVDATAGVAYETTRPDFTSGTVVQLSAEERRVELYSAFVQGRWDPLQDRLIATAGIKYEHHTDAEGVWQPSLKLAGQLNERQVLWASWTRAVRRPSTFEIDSLIWDETQPAGMVDLILRLRGSDAATVETLLAYEAGWRWRPTDAIDIDLAAFYFDYDDLVSVEIPDPADAPFEPPNDLIIDGLLSNRTEATYWGAECATAFRPRPAWELRAAVSGIETETTTPPGARRLFNFEKVPEWKLDLRSMHEIGRHWRLDVQAAWLEGFGSGEFAVEDQLRLQLFLTYEHDRLWDAGLSLEHLADSQTVEAKSDFFTHETAVERSAFLWWRARF